MRPKWDKISDCWGVFAKRSHYPKQAIFPTYPKEMIVKIEHSCASPKEFRRAMLIVFPDIKEEDAIKLWNKIIQFQEVLMYIHNKRTRIRIRYATDRLQVSVLGHLEDLDPEENRAITKTLNGVK